MVELKRGLLELLLGLCVVIAACEHHEREQGGMPARGGPPASSAVINIANVSAVSHVTEVAPKSGSGPDGAEVYARVCAACHQANGKGVPGAFPPLDGSSYVTGPNVERMAAIMLYGLMGPINVNGTVYNGVMLPQAGVLKDDELAAVGTYIRSSWSNKASPVEPAVFAKMREKYGTRGQFTIQELGEEK